MEENGDKTHRVKTLGTIRLHDEGTGEIVLIPQPSDDPNDPLNWYVTWSPNNLLYSLTFGGRSRPYRLYLTFLICFALFTANYLINGPSVVLVETTVEFFDIPSPSPEIPASLTPQSIAAFSHAVSKTAYLLSSPALSFGLSNLFWMPLSIKYGRRPISVYSFLLFTACTIWAARAQSWASALAARVIMAFGSGMAECAGSLAISDTFLLHERGKMMAYVS